MARNIRQLLHEFSRMTERLRDAAYVPVDTLDVTAWVTPEPAPFAERTSGTELTLQPGDVWGGLFDCAWFRFRGSAPAEAAGKRLALLIDLNGEALVVDDNGHPRLGLTTVASGYDFSLGRPGKRVVPWLESAAGGETLEIWADAGCNDLFGELRGGTLKEACVAVERPEVLALHYDWEVLEELMRHVPEDSARAHRIFAALYEAWLLLERIDDDTARAARAILAPELAKRGGDPSLRVTAIGHAHIDLAWLWPLRETIRKGARTFATSLRLMERYPDYVFGASQPQLYQWMKDHYPSVYDEVKARVAEGRWEAQGAMWVESDTNVPSGESLVRQVLYGKRFYRSEFGVDVTNLWLPDVFGYSGSLPQILRKAGVDSFMTQKLSWSIVNRYPHHTFLWRGIDGSGVLAHLPPEDTYNSSAAPRAIAKAEKAFLDKGRSEHCLVLFGIGDGGGGPGEEHVERLAREKDLAGLCPVTQEPSERFFERIRKDIPKLDSWTGELYLERHQGTFTTQARSKRYNRLMETALREAELACTRAWWSAGAAYPAAELESIWKEVLLYQFHDILPGSSITRVYEESLARYAALLRQTRAIAAAADSSFFARVLTEGMARPVGLSNALSWDRTDTVQVEGRWVTVTVPACGHAVVDLSSAPAAFTPPEASTDMLENEALRVRFDSSGAVASVFDKTAGREALAEGALANVLAVYGDDGDAWDFAMDYDARTPEQPGLVSTETFVDGPEAVVRQVYRFGQSEVRQDVVLRAGSRRLEFRTVVDWNESGRMLRTSFPTSVAADEATCEVQFGTLRRPTHGNTSWDVGRYEVCAQRFVDLSERGWGVALLNDCKYGHRVAGSTLDLNLLRSPGHPDPKADRATHRFVYALYPHAGDHAAGAVTRKAMDLNVPIRVCPVDVHPGDLPTAGSFMAVDAENVILDTVKKAEDGDAIIIRAYEAHGARTTAALTVAPGASGAELVDLMEENAEPLAFETGKTQVEFGPFELQTVRVGR